MKYLALLLVLSGSGWHWLAHVRDRNAAVAAGTAAYARGDAARAATAFAEALAAKARRQPDPRLLLNLAHAQARSGRQAAAYANYGRLLTTNAPAALSSIARQQLAVLAAQRGEIAQAAGLLRQALVLDPGNAGARFDYEVLSDYLAKRPNSPQIAPPPPGTDADTPKPAPEKNDADKAQAGTKEGTDHQDETNDSKAAPAAPTTPPARRPDAMEQPDDQRPSSGSGNAAKGGRQPGAGTPQPLASGEQPGTQRGLDRSSSAPASPAGGRSNRPGTEDATPTDVQLQTQRERLQAMNLSPAQARQLLETLRAQEQQYLQQLARPAAEKPDPTKPTW
ncbi:tetratricopeptide repeat protein [Hymenobacter rubidus]|uniref:hypothetical protein n=1 Tax=Hymenobacter rubidus TaxID=1441626 RepID=UPI00191E66D2|nr:hypothetical protein [Hymenobacter rubidus]